MKKYLLSIFAIAGAFSAYAAQVTDYCGEYQANFIDAFDNRSIKLFSIEQSETEGKVVLRGLYAPSSLGASTLEADIDLEAGTLSIPFTDMSDYDQGLEFFRGIYGEDGLQFSKEPIVGQLKEDGKIEFNPEDALIFGNYNEEWLYEIMRNVTFAPKTDLTFTYNEDEWVRIGTAEYPDLCFGYKIFDTREPVVSTVEVVQNIKNPLRIALLNPYQTAEWKKVNRDKEAVGQIVIDLTDPDLVVVEPYVYSGFNYNYGGLDLGKTYVYNNEGYYTKIAGMSTDEARNMLLDYGQPVSTFDGMMIYLARGSMIFGTETQPTAKFAFADIESAIELDNDALDAIEKGSVGICLTETDADVPVMYYDLMGNRVAQPARGGMYICRKGDRAVKVIF